MAFDIRKPVLQGTELGRHAFVLTAGGASISLSLEMRRTA